MKMIGGGDPQSGNNLRRSSAFPGITSPFFIPLKISALLRFHTFAISLQPSIRPGFHLSPCPATGGTSGSLPMIPAMQKKLQCPVRLDVYTGSKPRVREPRGTGVPFHQRRAGTGQNGECLKLGSHPMLPLSFPARPFTRISSRTPSGSCVPPT